ncbi:protein FAM71F1-like [Sphaerodactylus townsendi]|uniref:protein FAM71F1-like n=1 Tax=Sphaerodactylus townsendi TaxID=933632 RepID=UPI002025EECD|nr:protein FAM71F1-like [Sphaerodactylus townsendi]
MAAGALAGKPDADQKVACEEGRLSQLLRSPDYNLFPNSAVFESDFVQVTKKGKWPDLTNMPMIVSLGVTSSDPCLPLPNVLLMARHKVLDKGFVAGSSEPPELPATELTRLLPLRFVRLSVHHAAQRILRLQTVTRKVYYLQLHRSYSRGVFGLWSRLADILRRGLSTTPKDPAVGIRHSLVPSGSSPSGSSSGEPFSDSASPVQRAMDKRGRKALSGDFFSGKAAGTHRRGSCPLSPKRVSFQQLPAEYRTEVHEEVSAVYRSTHDPLHDAPPLPVCKQCERRLPKRSEQPQSAGRRVGVPQLQQHEPVSRLQPLRRLWHGTVEATGRK